MLGGFGANLTLFFVSNIYFQKKDAFSVIKEEKEKGCLFYDLNATSTNYLVIFIASMHLVHVWYCRAIFLNLLYVSSHFNLLFYNLKNALFLF